MTTTTSSCGQDLTTNRGGPATSARIVCSRTCALIRVSLIVVDVAVLNLGGEQPSRQSGTP